MAVGYNAGGNITGGSNNITIGYGTASSSATSSNEITFGNTAITRFRIPGLSLDTSQATNGQFLSWSSTGGAGGSGGFAW